MIKSFGILFVLLISVAVGAQEYSFVQFSVKDGLPQTQVYAMSSDEQGYLWLGTAGGAAKFDGKYFENYSSANGLKDNVVSGICSYNSFTWIFTNTGVTRIKGKNVKTFDLTEVLKGNYVAAGVFRESTNSLILGVKNQEIIEIPLADDTLDLTAFSVLTEKMTFSNIRHLYEDASGNIWVSSNGLFGYFDSDNQWNEEELFGSSLNISDVVQSKDGTYYVSVYDEGIYQWKNGTILQHFKIDDGLVSLLIRRVYIDSRGNVWATSKNGVSIIDGKQIKSFTLKNGLPNENIESVHEDNEGNIWLASDGSGAFRFTSDEFVTYRQNNGLGSNYVMSVVQDSLGDFWFGTYGAGISHLRNGTFNYYQLENGKLSNNIVWSSVIDHNNKMWFGTSDGLTVVSKDDFKTYANTDWLPSNKVTALYLQENNEVWIGTSKGLVKEKDGNFELLQTTENVKLKNIRSIEKGSHGKTWLGTSNGIYITDGELVEPWIHNDFLSDKVVYTIENYKDSIWFIGTANGLYYTDGSIVTKMEIHPSFGANYINFLGIENEEYLWVGTNYGIFEITLNAYLKDHGKGVLRHTENSGLTSVETNLNAIFIDQSNKVWMGTGDGLIRFDRTKRKQKIWDIVPKVQINQVQLFLKPTEWSKYTDQINPFSGIPEVLSLTYRNNYLTFYFSGLSLTHPDEVRYKIFLEGLDEEWTPMIEQNSFTYPNLGYGIYTFRVKASIDGIHWSDPAIFSFEIQKPYYLTWWFISLLVLTFLGLIWIIIVWQKNVAEQKRRTEKLVYKSRLLALEQQTLNASMNRHFIFNALNSIQYYINTQDRLSANKYLTSFAKLIRKNLDSSVSNTGLVSLADELERLELYVSLEHMRFQKKFDYEITVEPSIDKEEIQLPAMILQPFVENSIWHGLLPQEEGGKLSVKIFSDASGIVFEIEDNGIGYDVSQSRKTENSHHSRGMLITSGRIDILKKVNEQKMDIKGPFQVNDAHGNPMGTKVIIHLEVKKRN